MKISVAVVGATGIAGQQVLAGLCGSPAMAEEELGWKRQWSFEATITDLVNAELENRPELQRADPQAKTPIVP